MEGIDLIQDLGIVLLVAGLAGTLFKRIGLSVVVGYLIAGIVIGPHTPPVSLLTDVGRIEMLSQVGLVFLMFGIGLGLSLSKFRQMGAPTVIATALSALLVLNITRILGTFIGWSPAQSLFIAAIFMVSSSAVIAKVMQDLNRTHDSAWQMAMGITVLEDVVSVVMLAVLATQGSAGGSANIGALLLGISAFVVLLVSVGLSFLPRLLTRLDQRSDPEIRTIIVAGLLFLIALAAVRSGYSLALGAFLLGAIVADMPQRASVEKAFSGARDMFSSVFFVSIGMMIDLRLVADAWLTILGLGLGMTLVRIVATGLAMTLVGVPPSEARRASLALTPIGEFSFLIAQLGVTMAVLPQQYYAVSVGVSILTVFLMPLINRHAKPILRVVDRIEPNWIKRLLQVYHDWLAQLGQSANGRLWWSLSRKRVITIALEMLLVTGMFAFSVRILEAIQTGPLAKDLNPTVVEISFWSLLGLVALVPLVAIWRNISTLVLIFVEMAAAHIRVPARVLELALKGAAAVGLLYWFSELLPISRLSQWTWIIILAALVIVIAVFSRRIIYLHSEWQHSLTTALATGTPTAPPVPGRWLQQHDDWKLHVRECVLPSRAACAGRTIADLRIRSRYGCSVAEIDRQGYLIIAPDPGTRLFPGDRMLLIGQEEATDRACAELTQQLETSKEHFDEARLEVIPVPSSAVHAGTLADLEISRRLGVMIAGIERNGHQVMNPNPQEHLSGGDRLLVLGPPERVRAFRQWLIGRSPPAAA